MATPVTIEARGDALPMLALPLPRIAWIELTSKCPVDCVFCSRKAVRGNGEHMPFDLYLRLLQELERPLVLRLSYSGESGHYPRLLEALDAAQATRAKVELVTALVSVPEKTVRAMAERLDRITISLHTTSDDEFRRIYRYGSFRDFERRFKILEEVRMARGVPKLDFAFVAMESNLSSLENVVRMARDRSVPDVIVQPVMRRETFEYQFPELDSANHFTSRFAEKLRNTVDLVRSRYSGVRLQIDNPEFGNSHQPGPDTGQIISCAEDPWQTIHVMSNGAVISCGWRQAQPVGNLFSASLREIWQGPAYAAFRKAHREGCDPVCRRCNYKTTHPLTPLEQRLTAANASVRQMPAGWLSHDRTDGGILWAGSHASLEMPGTLPYLRVRGGLPPGLASSGNTLTIRTGGVEVATIENPSKSRMLHFDRVVRLPGTPCAARAIEFAVLHEFVPRDRGQSGDRRRLGFYLDLAECVESAPHYRDRYTTVGPDRYSRRRVRRLRASLAFADVTAACIRPLARWRRGPTVHGERPGVSIIIPERDSPDLLELCLRSVRASAQLWPEPLQVVVMTNGALPENYASPRARYSEFEFVCVPKPLTFCGAVRAGLRRARHDWVYLLNSDMVLEPGALAALAGARDDSIFAVASRIFLADRGSLPCETNWIQYRVVDGLMEVFHAPPPEGAGPFEILFGGGGCTLYRRRLLERYLGRHDPYAPFYFEDLDWATQGWRDGFRSLLCPASVATHQRRATINRFYGPAEAERIFERNWLQYQLRYVIEGVSSEAVLRRVEWADKRSIRDLTRWSAIASIAISRLRSGLLGAGALPPALSSGDR